MEPRRRPLRHPSGGGAPLGPRGAALSKRVGCWSGGWPRGLLRAGALWTMCVAEPLVAVVQLVREDGVRSEHRGVEETAEETHRRERAGVAEAAEGEQVRDEKWSCYAAIDQLIKAAAEDGAAVAIGVVWRPLRAGGCSGSPLQRLRTRRRAGAALQGHPSAGWWCPVPDAARRHGPGGNCQGTKLGGAGSAQTVSANRRSQACRRARAPHDAGGHLWPRLRPAGCPWPRANAGGGPWWRIPVVEDLASRPPDDGQASADDASPRPPEDAAPAAPHVVHEDPQRLRPRPAADVPRRRCHSGARSISDGGAPAAC